MKIEFPERGDPDRPRWKVAVLMFAALHDEPPEEWAELLSPALADMCAAFDVNTATLMAEIQARIREDKDA